MDDALLNRLGGPRISDRQIDELIGLAKGIAADDTIHQSEVEFLQKWLVANLDITQNPVIRVLYARVSEILADGVVDEEEKADLLETLNQFSARDLELGELMKSSTLPLCRPAPEMFFGGRRYCFTGTFNYGNRKACEAAVEDRGAETGPFTKATHYLVVGVYATDSWKHSSFGNKILRAAELRDRGHPVHIISEEHWQNALV